MPSERQLCDGGLELDWSWFHEKSDENGLVVESPAPEHSKLKFPIMAKPVELVDLNEPRMDTNERE